MCVCVRVSKRVCLCTYLCKVMRHKRHEISIGVFNNLCQCMCMFLSFQEAYMYACVYLRMNIASSTTVFEVYVCVCRHVRTHVCSVYVLISRAWYREPSVKAHACMYVHTYVLAGVYLCISASMLVHGVCICVN